MKLSHSTIAGSSICALALPPAVSIVSKQGCCVWLGVSPLTFPPCNLQPKWVGWGAQSSATAPLHWEELAKVARASVSIAPLNASLRMFSRHVSLRGDSREDPGHAGVTLSLICPRNTLKSFWKSWRMCLGRGKSRHLCLDHWNAKDATHTHIHEHQYIC